MSNNMKIADTDDSKQVKKSSILSILQKAKEGIATEINFELELPNDIKLNCSLRKSDALKMPEEDRFLFEDKLKICMAKGYGSEPINEDAWQREVNAQVESITESNKDKKKEDRINVDDFRKRYERENRPPNKAYQVARDLARTALVTTVIPKMIRVDGNLLDENERIEFADIMTSRFDISKKIIDKYVELSALFAQKDEAKNLSEGEN